jgi:hypothetical protein
MRGSKAPRGLPKSTPRKAHSRGIHSCNVVQLAVEAGDIEPVEDVEELGDELQPVPLGEEEGLRRAEVETDEVTCVK